MRKNYKKRIFIKMYIKIYVQFLHLDPDPATQIMRIRIRNPGIISWFFPGFFPAGGKYLTVPR